jgi:hypothetical protein
VRTVDGWTIGRRAVQSPVPIGVRDVSRSKSFYDAALEPLGYKCDPAASPVPASPVGDLKVTAVANRLSQIIGLRRARAGANEACHLPSGNVLYH